MLIKKISLFSFALSFVLFAQSQKEEVLMKVNNAPVYKSEFEQIYWKNKEESVASKEDLEEYVKLFVKFKLKVTEAEVLGLDTMPKFTNELSGYQSQLEAPYLIDSKVSDELIKEAYDRTTKEVRASHILVSLTSNASPKDTLEAYKKILGIQQKIEKGEMDFSTAARLYSDDPSAKSNFGDLGYFTAFRMVYPFENAAYNTPMGQTSKPFKTRFGYHIVKVTGTREGRGKVKVAHIMLRAKKDEEKINAENLEKKINELYQKALSGEPFDKLAQDFSEDRQSARKGGELNWIKSGETFAEFDSVAFSLTEDGEISKPILSPAGWHIIKRIAYEPVQSLEAMRTELKNKIQRDVRAQKTKESFINKLKKEYGFVVIRENLEQIINLVDASVLEGEWNLGKAEKLAGPLFSFADQAFSQKDLVAYIAGMQKLKDLTSVNGYVESRLNKMVDEKIMAYEKTQLVSKYPEFRALLKEYRDGILLFEITDQKVWSKAIKDTVGLKAFYEANKNDYTWPERLEGAVFVSADKKIINQAYKLAKKGQIKNDSIANYLNSSSQLNISLESGKFDRTDHEYLSKGNWVQGVNKPVLIDNKYVLVNAYNLLPARVKYLDEARGKITADYQDFLEKNWVEELESKYKVEIYQDVLFSIRNKP